MATLIKAMTWKLGPSVKINPSNQALILPGESPEADRRFERAMRLNGARDSVSFTLVVPPTSAETVNAGQAATLGFQLRDATDIGKSDTPAVSRPTARRESRRWKELYRMVTQEDASLPRGGKLDVVA
jgi:hypothetical protein